MVKEMVETHKRKVNSWSAIFTRIVQRATAGAVFGGGAAGLPVLWTPLAFLTGGPVGPLLYLAGVAAVAYDFLPKEDDLQLPVEPEWSCGEYEEDWAWCVKISMAIYIVLTFLCCGVNSTQMWYRFHHIAILLISLLLAAAIFFAEKTMPGFVFIPLLLILVVETCFAVQPRKLFIDVRLLLTGLDVEVYSMTGGLVIRLVMAKQETIGDLRGIVAEHRRRDIETVRILHGTEKPSDNRRLRDFAFMHTPFSVVFV